MAQTLDLESYRLLLHVDKNTLDDALQNHAECMEEIGQEVVTRNSRMLAAKNDLETIEGKLSEQFREDDEKATVSVIRSKVVRDGARMKVWYDYQFQRADHEKWQQLHDAWKTRGYSIKTLADLFAADYFAINSTKKPEPRVDRQYENTRTAMAEKRRTRAVEVYDEPVVRRRV